MLADIFLGKITNWNDPRIAKDNPGVHLPDQKIIVVHRSDGSGTTFIWTDFLSKISKEWASGPGKGTSINWPTGVGGKGNEGVAGYVRQLPGAIGYVELIYALQNHIDFGSVQNAARKLRQGLDRRRDGRRGHCQDTSPTTASPSPTLRAPTPIPSPASPTCSIPTQPKNMAKEKVIKDMLSWCIKSGESEVSTLSYAPLPQNLASRRFSKPSTPCRNASRGVRRPPDSSPLFASTAFLRIVSPRRNSPQSSVRLPVNDAAPALY